MAEDTQAKAEACPWCCLHEARIRELEAERDARSCNGHCQDCDEHRWQREHKLRELEAEVKHWKITAECHANMMLRAQDMAKSTKDVDILVFDLLLEVKRKDEALEQRRVEVNGLRRHLSNTHGCQSGYRCAEFWKTLDAALAPRREQGEP